MLFNLYVYVCATVTIYGFAKKDGMPTNAAMLLSALFPVFVTVAAVQCLTGKK